MHRGLVLMRGSMPPGGATGRANPWLFTVARKAIPFAAAASPYSPSRPMRLHLAQAPVGVRGEEGRRFLQDFKWGARFHPAVADGREVLHHANHAVRIV